MVTASDRSVLIRLASGLTKGSAERKAVLNGLAKVAAVDPAIMVLVDKFMNTVQETMSDHFAAHNYGTPPVLGKDVGQRYIRIYKENPGVKGRSAFAFVDTQTGDLLKPAGWKAPAKGARGNLYDEAGWKNSHGPWGMNYLR